MDLMKAAALKLRLREGQAYDALNSICQTLIYLSGNLISRSEHIREQKMADLLAKHCDTYRRAREALLNLGMSTNDTAFQELKDEDLVMESGPSKKTMGNKEELQASSCKQ
ncbi:hypothetical protein M422DRAFT_47829 [Sphaerobolus stellatus SS14]|uniref:Uncharacterized protein n=1 Tax=Sphaerobolus stellatus (strain SS14) TaxID=990650 RepID=A0A0C9VNJ1_SPHS4|nr:hypothetical protein M422DRAFT_47829 [Sphaerobolus stellatus SS14]